MGVWRGRAFKDDVTACEKAMRKCVLGMVKKVERLIWLEESKQRGE